MRSVIAAAGLAIAACSQPPSDTDPADMGEINIYSARHYDSDRILYDAFEAETGITVRFREAGAAQLLETMKAEGAASPADVVIAADAGTLWRFQDAGLLQPVQSDALDAAIPAQLREADGHWFGLAKRVRVIAYDPERLAPEQVDDYLDLADPGLAGEVCMRSSSNVYNLSLLGDMIERVGAEAAEAWAGAVAENFARDPEGGDTAQIESVAAGACSATIVNHYYWVRLAADGSNAQKAAAEKVSLSFPGSEAGGTHVNVTGAGVAANAPNRDAAIRFLEFLATPDGQTMLTTETKEFPIVAGATPPAGLDLLPTFEEATTQIGAYGENQVEAQAIYDRVGWN
ncbi:MAG: extracellular solute-binding protein [Pseudomonadota bacterium]